MGRLASELLRLPVRAMGVRLGRPVDLLLDVSAMRAVGMEVECGDEVTRVLPLAAARLEDDHIAVDSAFILIDHGERSFYRNGTRPLGALRGADVVRAGRRLGRLDDLEVAADGAISAVVLAGGERVRPVEGVDLLADAAASAA